MSSEWEVTDYDGKLAICLRLQVDWREPKTTQFHLVSNIKASEYAHLVGRDVYFSNGVDVGRIYRTGGGDPIICDVRGWERITKETPIAAPRNGREYGWVWGSARWNKDYFPRCDACYHYHDPSFAYCDNCGHCHKHGKKCKAG